MLMIEDILIPLHLFDYTQDDLIEHYAPKGALENRWKICGYTDAGWTVDLRMQAFINKELCESLMSFGGTWLRNQFHFVQPTETQANIVRATK